MADAHAAALAALRADLIPLLDEARAALDLDDLDATLDRLGVLAARSATARHRARTHPGGQLDGQAVPVTVRHAAAYLTARARDPALTVGHAAAHCAVSPRALQAAFRRHLGITPSGFLRGLRLEGARAELTAAGPGTTTVAAVAARWGWTDRDSFTAAYRAAHSVTPSATLRSPAGPASTATTPTPGPG